MTKNTIAQALEYKLSSPNVADSNLEPANIVDMLDKLSVAIGKLAEAMVRTSDVIENHSELIAEIGLYE